MAEDIFVAIWVAGVIYFVFFHHRLFLAMRAADVPLVEAAIAKRGLAFVACRSANFFEQWKQPPASGWARFIIAEATKKDGTPVEVRLTIDPSYDKNLADIRLLKVLT